MKVNDLFMMNGRVKKTAVARLDKILQPLGWRAMEKGSSSVILRLHFTSLMTPYLSEELQYEGLNLRYRGKGDVKTIAEMLFGTYFDEGVIHGKSEIQSNMKALLNIK